MRQIHCSRTAAIAILIAGLAAGACKHPTPTAIKQPDRTPISGPTPPVPPPTPCATPSVTLTANSSSINRGQVSTLVWEAFNAQSLRIEPELGNVPLTGNRQVTPQTSVTYQATATSPCGSNSGVARITVNEAIVRTPVEVVPIPPVITVDGRGGPTTPPPAPPGRGGPVNVLQPARDPSFDESMLSILFDYDKAELRPDQMTQLQKDATWLKNHQDVRVVVEGHADERGNQEYNLALGVRRANTVVQFLVSQGVTESRIRSISYGKERPVCQDATPDESCHQRNRRAAFAPAR